MNTGLALILIAGFAGLLIVVLALLVMGIYNKLVRLRNRYENAFAQIDVQLKRRYDLIPNLVETVKGYMKHERETLEAVISARNLAYSAEQEAARQPGNPQAIRTLGGAEMQLSSALSRLMAVAEAYPDLKANQNMIASARGVDLHREQGRLRPTGLQRLRDAIQHRARAVSRRAVGRVVWLPRSAIIRSRG